MSMDLVSVLKWVKSVMGYTLYKLHLSALYASARIICKARDHSMLRQTFNTLPPFVMRLSTKSIFSALYE